MALKQGTNPEAGAPKEVNISSEMADHLRNMTIAIAEMQSKPEVREYIDTITRRNLLIEEVAKIAGVPFGDGRWTLDMAAGKFIENAGTNGQA